MVRIAPTQAQQVVLDQVVVFWRANGYPPAVRDLAGALELSTSTVQYHLDNLESAGWIERDPNIARSIRLAQGERISYDPHTDSPHSLPDPRLDPQPAGSADPDPRRLPAVAER